MRKLINITSWIIGACAIFLVSAAGSKRLDDAQISSINIDPNKGGELYYINQKDVLKILHQLHPSIDSMGLQEVNIKMLEESLDNHPSILKAEVYSNLEGVLFVDISQRKPVFRVRTPEAEYYIDELGDSVALSPNYSANVPLVTGAINAAKRQEVFEFFSYCKSNSFYRSFFDGIEISAEEEWTLFPKEGSHKVYLGSFKEYKQKLKKLKVYYTQAVTKENIESIAYLNLKYENQVVSRKK